MNSNDPIEYLKKVKTIIIKDFSKVRHQPGFESMSNSEKKERGSASFNKLVSIANQLKDYRIDREKSREIIIKNLSEINNQSLAILWLLKALNRNDTYVFAYNYLSQKFNREANEVLFPIKEIFEDQLLNLLDKEDTQIETQWSGELFALAFYYLEQSRYLKGGNMLDRIRSARNLTGYEKNKDSYVRKIYYQINGPIEKSPLNAKNLHEVIDLLVDYPRAKKLAQKELFSFE